MYKLTSDPRTTRVGRVLREFSLGELLPQLVNVIRGKMSLVDPRSALPSEVQMYDDRALARRSVKPGVTGPRQISGRNHLTFGDMIDVDIRYVRNWGPWLNGVILLGSVPVVVFERGAA